MAKEVKVISGTYGLSQPAIGAGSYVVYTVPAGRVAKIRTQSISIGTTVSTPSQQSSALTIGAPTLAMGNFYTMPFPLQNTSGAHQLIAAYYMYASSNTVRYWSGTTGYDVRTDSSGTETTYNNPSPILTAASNDGLISYIINSGPVTFTNDSVNYATAGDQIKLWTDVGNDGTNANQIITFTYRFLIVEEY